jgi:hypothetical protein
MASVHQYDTYASYEIGLCQLLDRLGQNHPHYSEALVYRQRLTENITRSRRYGDTETRKAERAEIVEQLNVFALSVLGSSFSDLCGLIEPASGRVPPGPSRHVYNPYNYGNVVKDPEMFFGRGTDLNALCARLRNMQSTSVVGLRRIGKSSLLYQLARIIPDKLGSKYIPLNIDLQDARCRTVVDFVQSVVTALNDKMGGLLTVSNVKDMRSFSDVVEKISRSDFRLVLCLDEFEEFTQHPGEFRNEFFEALRALGGSWKLAMVTTSRMPLATLIEKSGIASPLDNIFSSVELGLLEPDAAQALRREPFRRQEIVLASEDEALIRELGGRHPFFLQMACYHFYEALDQPQSGRAEIVRENFDREANPHFERLWKPLSLGEQAALRAVVDRAVRTDETDRVLKQLERLGMVEKADGAWAIFSPAFARRIEQYRQVTNRARGRGPSLSKTLLLYAGVATAVVAIAALISTWLPEQQILPMLVIAAVILLFALVGVGKLTGRDLLQWLGDMLGKLFRPGGS